MGLFSFFNQVHFFSVDIFFFCSLQFLTGPAIEDPFRFTAQLRLPGQKRLKNGLKRADQRNDPTEAIKPFFSPADGPTVRLGSGFTTLAKVLKPEPDVEPEN